MNYNPYGMYNNGVNFPVNMPQMGFDPMMKIQEMEQEILQLKGCLLYTSPSPRD